MKVLRIILALLLLGLIAKYAHADVKISALPAAGALTGTEAIAGVQPGSCAATGGTCQISPAQIATYVNAHLVAFSGDCTTPGGSGVITCTKINGAVANTGAANLVWATPNGASGATGLRALMSADIPAINLAAAGNGGVAGNLPLGSLATEAATTIVANATSGTATPTAVLPIQVAILEQAQLIARVATTANITLSGAQTIDGVTVGSGSNVSVTVLVKNQTTASQNGLYISSAGAWTRSPAFPSGFVLPVNCDISFFITSGTLQGGSVQRLGTVASLTIGTSALSFTQLSPLLATDTNFGAVELTAAGGGVVPNAPGSVGAVNDCAGYADLAGSLIDFGNVTNTTGPCVVSDATGHVLMPGNGTAPTVSSGTLATGGSDQHGRVTGLTAVTSLTVTFSSVFGYVPSCGGSDSAGTVIGVSSVTASAVTFTVAALTGSLNYWCF